MADYLDIIKQFEGFSPRPYGDYKQTSIGYGTRARPGDTYLSPEEGEQRLREEADKVTSFIDQNIPGLDPSKRAALTSFGYNLGTGHGGLSDLVPDAQAGNWDAVAKRMQRYIHAGGSVNPGLVSRRAAEANILTGGTMPSTSSRLTASKLRERYGATPAASPQVIEQVAPDAELATSGGGGSILDRLAAALGGGSGSPADRLADARRMIEAGRSATVASPWQLAGSLAQQGVGRIKEYYANKDQKNMDAALTQAITGGGASNPAALARTLIASGNPQYRTAGIEMLAKSMTPRQDEWVPSPDGAVVVNKATGEVRDTGRQNLKTPRIVTVKDPETGYDVSAEVLPDGSMRRLDPNALPGAGQPPVTGAAGVQPSATRTAPVMPKVLRDQLLRKDAEAMEKYRESAGEASNLAGSIDELEVQRGKAGGFPGSAFNNPFTRFIGRNIGGGGGVIPTSEEVAALDAMAAPSTAMQLGFTSKTKGAVSDREMALFANAVPDANMTDEAARGVIDAQRAVLQRAEEKANFYENWLATQGSGRGFQEAWSRFTRENPVIQTDAKGNIVANKENVANWQRYLNPAAAVTPGVGTAERPPETAPQPEGTPPTNAIPQAAIDYLKTNPAMRDQFIEKYGEAGKDAAIRILGE